MAGYLGVAMGKLQTILTEDIVEIAINPDGRVWQERRGDPFMKPAELELKAQDIGLIADQIANTSKTRVSEEKSVYSTSVSYENWQIRCQVLRQPAVAKGIAISMRFFNPQSKIFDPVLLYGETRSASAEREERNRHMRELAENSKLIESLEFAVESKLNVVVSGGTSSGKTMVARFMQGLISDNERIITIEDAPDLLPEQPNRVEMVSVEGNSYRSPDKLMQACLRMRPDRIILSEIRGSDAYTFLKAINTGHGGSITTLHADTAELAVSRMAQAALEAAPAMTFSEMKSYIAQSIDVIVQTKNDKGKRGVVEIFLPKEGIKDV